MLDVDISAILNLHREGLLAHPSIISLALAKSRAESGGIKVEVVAVLDHPDDLTRDVLTASNLEVRVVESDAGDLGEARNIGVRSARGSWIALLDGDDLWGEDWLLKAHAASTKDARQIIWHPETNLYFGADYHLFRHIDMEEHLFEPLSLMMDNYWTSLCFAKRSVFLDIPYQRNDLKRQLGYEDWSWNMDTIARGLLHKIVPGTAHAVRLKPNSLLQKTRLAVAIPHPSSLFQHIVLSDT